MLTVTAKKAVTALLLSLLPLALLVGPPPASATPPAPVWTTSWATSQHATGPQLVDRTVRMVVHLTQGGTALRVRLANTLGTVPLQLGAVSVGVRSGGAAAVAGTLRPVTFTGRTQVAVPPGQFVVSDLVELRTAAQQEVLVFVPGPATPSQHSAAFDTSYLTPAGAGDATAATDGDAFTETISSSLIVSAVDVLSTDVVGAVVIVGGSVTDGTGSRKTGPLGVGPAAPPNSRWSDVLARRISAELPRDAQLTVANAGIEANTASRSCGLVNTPYSNVQDRLNRDVLSLSNVEHLVVYAGTNDLGFGCSADQITEAFRDIISRARTKGIRVHLSTSTPRAVYTPLQNEQRNDLNAWITKWNRCGGECDGTVNFDAAISSGVNPNAIDPRYDAGDDIHPNAEGYRLMGETIDLDLLRTGDAPQQVPTAAAPSPVPAEGKLPVTGGPGVLALLAVPLLGVPLLRLRAARRHRPGVTSAAS